MRPSDTMLVESIVSFLFGFAVLQNQVQDNLLGVFFGAWIAIAGGNRISQSIAVSRYHPRDWFKIMPLAMLDALLGAFMMMPELSESTPAIMLVGLAFIINGLSLLVYAMYMKMPENRAQQKAQDRAEAKKAAAEAKRKQRREMRSLSRRERLAAETVMKAEKRAAKEAKRLEREAAKEARRPELDRTLTLSKEESAEIARIAEESGFAEEVRQAEAAARSADAIAIHEESGYEENPADAAGSEEIQAAPESATMPEEAATDTEQLEGSPFAADPSERASDEENTESAFQDSEDGGLWPTFKRPVAIPSLRPQRTETGGEPETKPEELKLAAVNLEEIESGTPEVAFEKVELPQVELQSEGGESARRAEIIRWLREKSRAKAEAASSYKPISLDELIPEEMPHRNNSGDDKRFTQTLSFSWDEDAPGKDAK